MKQRNWVKKPLFAPIAALGLGASLAFSACYTGDQSCSEAYNQNDPNDHCPYGPPGGPRVDKNSPPVCGIIAPLDPNGADCKVGFVEDVYPIMIAGAVGNCTGEKNGGGCHSNSQKGIAPFAKDSPQSMLDALSAYKGELTRKYYDPDDPKQSWWICNLRGDIGTLMPTSGTPKMKAADIALTERWLGCGAPYNRPGGGGAGGAGGGTTTTM